MPDFSSLLDKPANDYKKPKPFPIGDYPAIITRQLYGESNKNKTPFCRFELKLLGWPDEIQDEEKIDENGKLIDPTKKAFRIDYWLSEDATYRLGDFVKEVAPGDTRPLKAIVPELPNTHVLASLTKGMDEATGDEFNRVDKLSAMP